MKRQVLRLLLAMAITFAWQSASSQDLEKDRYSQLDNFLNYLNSKGINDADEVITKTEAIAPICAPLESIIRQFKTRKSESVNKINERLQRRSQLDMSVQVILIDGTVESQTKGYSIISSNGSLIAVRVNAPIGSTYKGYVKKGEGAVAYKPLGGNSQILQVYLPVSGGSPQEHYSALTKQVDELQSRYGDLWEKFKTECIREVSAEREKVKQNLLGKHYAIAEDFLNKKEYDSALREFSFVKTLDPHFKDVDEKLDLANNKNHIVRQSDVYEIVSPKQNLILLGTSRGIFESSNAGRTWKLKAFEGKRVPKLDATGERVLAYVEPNGIQYSADGGIGWGKLSVRYTVVNRKYDDRSQSYVEVFRLPIIQPDFKVKNLKLVHSYTVNLVFIEYTGSKGVYRNENQVLNVEKNWLSGDYYIDYRGEWITIPEKCFSADNGRNWVAFWKNTLATLYHADDRTVGAPHQIKNWMDIASEYTEDPEDAINKVIDFITERKKIGEDQVKVIAYSFARKVKKEDSDRVLILTNNGLYKTCWDCEQVEEVAFAAKYGNPLSVFSDDANPSLIMIGLEGHGLLISSDGGLTWEGI